MDIGKNAIKAKIEKTNYTHVFVSKVQNGYLISLQDMGMRDITFGGMGQMPEQWIAKTKVEISKIVDKILDERLK